MSNPPKFNVLSAEAADLVEKMQRGELTSVEIVETYLEQIEAQNQHGLQLRAIAAVAPRDIVLKQARLLDAERRAGTTRSLLHGIPLIVKDTIVTGPELGMPTTAGTVAFETAVAKRNAGIIDRLLGAGLIIIGKASMSEYCGSHELPAGYSASNGQPQSPYIRGGRRANDGIAGPTSPGGSSTGAGAGVAAGFVPLSMGTDTVGSVVMPANRASLFSMKLPSNTVPMDGVFSMARGWDSLGPMAKSARDLELLVEVLQAKTPSKQPIIEPVEHLRNLRIGMVDFKHWQPICILLGFTEDQAQMEKQYEDVARKLAELGSLVTYPISFVSNDAHQVDGKTHNFVLSKQEPDSIPTVGAVQFTQIGAEGRENFKNFTNCFDSTPVRSVEDLIKFNEENKERAMPLPESNNSELLNWANDSTKVNEKEKIVHQMIINTRKVLDELFEQFDVVLLPGDCMYASIGSAARYPFGTVPLGYLESVGMPQGLTVGVGKDKEDIMIRFMKGFEAGFPKRRVPPQLA